MLILGDATIPKRVNHEKKTRVPGCRPAGASHAEPKKCECAVKIILDHRNVTTTAWYAYLRLAF